MKTETRRAFEAAIEIAFELANLARGRKPGAAKRLERKLDAAVAKFAPDDLTALIGAMVRTPEEWAEMEAALPPGNLSGHTELLEAMVRRRKRLLDKLKAGR